MLHLKGLPTKALFKKASGTFPSKIEKPLLPQHDPLSPICDFKNSELEKERHCIVSTVVAS